MDDEIIRIFCPVGVSSMNYRKEYPDLVAIPEFTPLNDNELIMIWHYSNPTSPIVYLVKSKQERMIRAYLLAIPGSDPTVATKYSTDFINGVLSNSDDLRAAADRMSRIYPSIRDQASNMVNKMLRDYMDLLEKDLDEFKKVDGETDFSAYTLTRKRIFDHLDSLIQKAESGFGTKKMSDRRSALGEKISEKYLKQKANAGKNILGNVSPK